MCGIWNEEAILGNDSKLRWCSKLLKTDKTHWLIWRGFGEWYQETLLHKELTIARFNKIRFMPSLCHVSLSSRREFNTRQLSLPARHSSLLQITSTTHWEYLPELTTIVNSFNSRDEDEGQDTQMECCCDLEMGYTRRRCLRYLSSAFWRHMSYL